MIFSKEKFLKNAPKGIKRQLSTHLDAIDGAEVEFDKRYGNDGTIKQYFADGQPYYLYPVYKNWCVEKEN